MHNSPMKAMILAAGFGKRLRPMTDTLPKPMIAVADKPLIVYHIEKLADAGITEIVINTAYLAEKITDALGNGEQWGVRLHYSAESIDNPLETAGGIRHALGLLTDNAPLNQPFIVVNADIWSDYDYRQLNSRHFSAQQLAHLVLIDNPDFKQQGDFGLSTANTKTTACVTNQKQLTFSGISVLSPRLFAPLADNTPAALGALLREHIGAQHADNRAVITGEHYSGQWFDCGTVERWQALDAWARCMS